MTQYQRGNLIPEHLRDHRFYTKNGTPSAYALNRWWRLLSDGSPAPNAKSFATKEEIQQMHELKPELGECEILGGKIGRPSTGFDAKEYHRNYWRKNRV